MSVLKWATLPRKQLLVKILSEYMAHLEGWKLDLITGEFYNPQYDERIQVIIKDWKSDDREQAKFEWQAERKAMHSLSEKTLPLRGHFSGVSSEIWHNSQPVYYLESIGMDALRMKPFARVKLAGSYQHLYIELGDSLRSVSKNRRRKAIRYNKPLPLSVNERVTQLINEAVNHYFNN